MNPRIRQVRRTASTRLKFAHPQAASTGLNWWQRIMQGPPRSGNDLAPQESSGQVWLWTYQPSGSMSEGKGAGDFLTPFGGRYGLNELVIFCEGIAECLQGDVLWTGERAVHHVGPAPSSFLSLGRGCYSQPRRAETINDTSMRHVVLVVLATKYCREPAAVHGTARYCTPSTARQCAIGTASANYLKACSKPTTIDCWDGWELENWDGTAVRTR